MQFIIPLLLYRMMFPCAYKQLLGFDCPLCGGQRSLLMLLSGDVKGSFLMYPPLIPVLVLIGFFIAHLVNNKIVAGKFLVRYSLITLAVVMVNYIFSLIFSHTS